MKYSIITILVLIVSISQSVESSGIGWEHIGLKGIKDSLQIEAIGTFDSSTIIAGDSKQGRIFISKNDGDSWDTLCKDIYKGTEFSVLKMIDGVIFAGYTSRPVSNLMTSVDTGKTWVQHLINDGGIIYSIEKLLGSYFVGSSHLCMSNNGYSNWQWMADPEYGNSMMAIANKNDSIYLCSYNGFHMSADTCKTWTQVSLFSNTISLCVINNSIILTDENGSYRSDDSFDTHFKKISTGASYCYSINDSILIRRKNIPKVYELFYSLDKGDSWVDISLDFEGAENAHISQISSNGKYLFALTDSGVARLTFDKMFGTVPISSKKITQKHNDFKINGSSFHISSSQVNSASLKLYSLSGRLLAHEESINLSVGTYRIKSLINRYFKNSNIPSTFIFSFKADEFIINRVVVNR